MNIRNLLCCAVAISILAFSNASALEKSLGVKAGVNLANMRGNDMPDETKMKAGLSVGAAFQLKLMNMFAVQPELLFAQKGSKATTPAISEGDIEIPSFTSKITLNYLEIPVLAQFLIPVPVQIISPMVYAGPSFGFKLGKPTVKINDEKQDVGNDTFSTFDFGIAFGGGFGVKAGPGNAVVDIRYTLGATKLKDGFDERNGALTLGAGYMYSF